MLTYLLALVVGLSSFALYMSAFFYPGLYRKGDLAWSGVGLFYALVLWFSAERITGGVLLGQMAGVALMGWLGWQAFNARLGEASPQSISTTDLKTGLEKVISPEQREKLTAQANQQFSKVKQWAQALLSTTATPQETTSTADTYTPLKREDFGQPPVTIETPASVEMAEPTAIAEVEITVPPEIEPTPSPVIPSEVSSAEVSSEVKDKPNPTDVVTDLFKSVTSIFKQPKKNTSTYVRREFRDTPVETTSSTSAVAEVTAEVAEVTAASLDDVKAASTDTIGSITAAVTEKATRFGGFVEKLKDSVGKVAQEQVAGLSKSAAQVQDALTDVVEEPLETLKEASTEVKDSAIDATQTIKDAVAEQAQEVQDGVLGVAQEQIDSLHDAAKDVQDVMQETVNAPADPPAATEALQTAVTETTEVQANAIDPTVTEGNAAIADAAPNPETAIEPPSQDAIDPALGGVQPVRNVVDDLLDTLDDQPKP